ncbi:PREDICTED: uncharacterized protein LOC109176423 [Ipomoea nil]|uniref:uncharacterized protein LOC109176423 n=1 Tax=Ipomoea nil TaxID=35883 RepID=UPI000901074B|nr:PREDICTED: uncharacterized protein LOC109176423 [Ipomoea nil]
MNLLSWNVRGLLSSRRRLKRLLRRKRIRFSAIIEPMLAQDRLSSMITELGFSNGYASMESKIWLLWTEDYEVEVVIDAEQFLCCNIIYLPWRFAFCYVAVYGSHTRTERLQLWEQLTAVLEDSSPVLLGGDFNVISSLTEYRGNANPDTNSNNLVDIAILGNQYTWVLARTSLDHAPLLFNGTNEAVSIPKQFRFQSMWFSHPGFMEVVMQSWGMIADGGGMRALAFKLKRLKTDLKHWNKNTFGNIFDRIQSLEMRVSEAERVYEDRPAEDTRTALHALQADLLLALKQEECFWKQKTRARWLREGDANTKFFHSVVKEKHRRQRISAVKDANGLIVTEQDEIRNEAVTFFSGLFSTEECLGLDTLLQCLPSGLDPSDAARLIALLSREEVKAAVWKLDPDSAAGPDGFSGVFFKHCWDLIQEDVFWAVQDFLVGVPIPRAIASAQIVLIPKKDHPGSFADYRPICLCTFASKIFTRIVASRLSPILPKLISREQVGFVSGRNIQDNILLALEMLQYIDKRCRGSNVIIKLDMMKAFDRVSWAYLRAVLEKLGFPSRFINVIMGNLEATRLSVLVNGVSSGFFQPSRGVKQGDPLSPLLFILAFEALSRLLIMKMGVGLLTPYYTSPANPQITHLAFADDIVIFVNVSIASLRALAELLLHYQEGSGQKINYNKSFFITSRRCANSRVSAMSGVLNMQQSNWPFRYLGASGLSTPSRRRTQPSSTSVFSKGTRWRRMLQPQAFVDDNSTVTSGAVVWTLDTFGEFTLSSAYEALRLKASKSLSSCCIWGEGVPSRISVFMWRLLRCCLPFPDILQQFNLYLPSVCPLCHCSSADLEHCLYHCRNAKQVWNFFRGIFGMFTAASSLRAECHAWWLFAPPGSAVEWCARLLPCLFLYLLWCSYNQGIYGHGSMPASITINRVKRELYEISTFKSVRRKGPGDDLLIAVGIVAGFAVQP